MLRRHSLHGRCETVGGPGDAAAFEGTLASINAARASAIFHDAIRTNRKRLMIGGGVALAVPIIAGRTRRGPHARERTALCNSSEISAGCVERQLASNLYRGSLVTLIRWLERARAALLPALLVPPVPIEASPDVDDEPWLEALPLEVLPLGVPDALPLGVLPDALPDDMPPLLGLPLPLGMPLPLDMPDELLPDVPLLAAPLPLAPVLPAPVLPVPVAPAPVPFTSTSPAEVLLVPARPALLRDGMQAVEPMAPPMLPVVPMPLELLVPLVLGEP